MPLAQQHQKGILRAGEDDHRNRTDRVASARQEEQKEQEREEQEEEA